MLYWFRTPPGVKVGRAALDEEAIRLIEQLNPGMEFDWPRIIKGQGSPASEPRPLVEARRQRPDNRRSQSQTPAPSRPVQRPPAAEPDWPRRDLPTVGEPAVAAEPVVVKNFAELPVAEVVAAIADEVQTPAHARIGAEGVRQLRGRYGELLARISELPDETRRAELKQQADRLNPDAWVTGDEVAQGLEQYRIGAGVAARGRGSEAAPPAAWKRAAAGRARRGKCGRAGGPRRERPGRRAGNLSQRDPRER